MFHARDGAIFSKNSTFVFFDGASPITENGIQLRSPSPIMAPDNTNWEQKLERRLFSLGELIFALDSKYVRYKQRNTVCFIKFY